MELNDNIFISEVSTPVNESISLVVPIINEVYSSATEENVTYTIDSEEYNVTKTNSEISIDYTFDTLGQYTVIVDYDNDNLYVIDVYVLNKANIIVDEIPTQIVYTNTTITGTLVDNEGNPISGRQVVAILVTANTSIIVDSVVTDENGRWAFNFTLKDAGEYILYVGSNNDDTYNATQLITTFDVRRLNTEVSFDSSTMNVSYSLNSPYALTINVVDEEGNPVENGSVAIKINGITYYDYGGIVYADVVDGVATFI